MSLDGISVTHADLKAYKHYPIGDHELSKFSPVIWLLFLYDRSSSNCQYPTTYFLNGYLTKYVAAIDKSAIVLNYQPLPRQDTTMRAKVEYLNNTKVTSVNWQVEQREASRKNKRNPQGRPLTQMEALTVVRGYPLIQSNICFIHIPSLPKEFRTVFLKKDHKRRIDKVMLLSENLFHPKKSKRAGQRVENFLNFKFKQLSMTCNVASPQTKSQSSLFSPLAISNHASTLSRRRLTGYKDCNQNL